MKRIVIGCLVNCIDGGKFDSHVAAKSLRAYERKLRLEKRQQRRRRDIRYYSDWNRDEEAGLKVHIQQEQ